MLPQTMTGVINDQSDQYVPAFVVKLLHVWFEQTGSHWEERGVQEKESLLVARLVALSGTII